MPAAERSCNFTSDEGKSEENTQILDRRSLLLLPESATSSTAVQRITKFITNTTVPTKVLIFHEIAYRNS